MTFLIIVGAKYLFLVIILAAVTIFFTSNNQIKNKLILLSLLVLPLSFILGKILNLLIKSPRPFIVDHVTPLIQSSHDNGFPSDHTLLSMTVASIIFAYNRKVGTVLYILALCVGISRVLAHVHHPIDILGSIVIALSVTYISYHFLVEKLGKKLELNKKLFKDEQ